MSNLVAANASETRLAFVPQSGFGVTPTNPTFQNLRITGESLVIERQNVVSDEIRPDRNISDLIQVGGGASGDVNFELSYGTFDALLEGALQGSWSTNVLKNGIVQPFFLFEKTFETGTTDAFLRYESCAIDTMTLNIAAREIVTGSFSVMGKGGSTGSSIISGATYTAATTTDVLDAASSFADLSIDGVSPAPDITSITLNLTNNLRQQPVVGQVDTAGIGKGRFQVSGTVEMYFASLDIYDLFLAGTASALSFTIGKTAGSRYTFDLPNIKFDTADAPATGNDTDVILTMGFQGLYDVSEACSLKITRAA